MSEEMLQRMKTAGEYQRKAIYALFPEKVGSHLEAIENEIKMMLLEMAVDAMKECEKKKEEKQDDKKISGTKKIDIM